MWPVVGLAGGPVYYQVGGVDKTRAPQQATPGHAIFRPDSLISDTGLQNTQQQRQLPIKKVTSGPVVRWPDFLVSDTGPQVKQQQR